MGVMVEMMEMADSTSSDDLVRDSRVGGMC